MKNLRNKKITFIVLLTLFLTVWVVINSNIINIQSANAQPAVEVAQTAGPATSEQAAAMGPIATTKSPFWGWLSGSFIGDIMSSAITFPIQVVGYLFGFITKTLFVFGGWLIKLGLNMNAELLSPSSPVIYGWKIVLSFANLGFVLAIIVIAFATIFRRQTYAMKETLWKLIVAALLVNFSLMIAGAFINVSEILTKYLLDASTMSGQGITSFSDTFAGIFQVQGFLKMADLKEGFNQSTLQGAAAIGNLIGTGVLTNITGIFFLAGFTLVSAITLLAIAIMLLIRYVYLGILLILVPIVWLFWIFPATQKFWQQWWTQFLRWTFFPPIMLFFLYLDIYTMRNMKQTYIGNILTRDTVSGELARSIGFTFGLDVVGNLVIVLGLAVGGLIAANSLSITFAGTALGWTQSIGKSFGGWVGRKGIQAGTSPLRSTWGVKAIEAIERFGTKDGKPRETRLGKTWQLLTKPIRTQVGERLSGLAAIGAEKAVAEVGERYKDWEDIRGARAYYTMDAEERAYWGPRLSKNKNMDLLPDASALINDKTRANIIEHGLPPPVFTNMERTVGFDIDSLRALREGDFEKDEIDAATGKKTGKKIKVTLKSARRDFWRSLRPEHAAKLQVDNYFRAEPKFGLSVGEKEKMHSEDAEAILETNPDLIANIFRGIKGVNLDNFNDRYLLKFMREQAKAAGKETIKDWLESEPTGKYKKVVTFLGSSAARNLGISIEVPIEDSSKQPFTSA